MNKNIEHYFFHKKNVLEKSFCENAINELKKNEWEKHVFYSGGGDGKGGEPTWTRPSGDNEPEVINSENFDSSIGEINKFILQSLHSIILEYIESYKFDWFFAWEGYSAMKFIRYSQGQTMKNHCDHIHTLFDGKRKGIPILSIIGLLNDDYEGGELIMFEDKKIDTKVGDVLIFPSNFLYPHEVTPVSKGVRYSYVSWVW